MRCIRFIRFGPGSESNESNAARAAPRTLDSDTTPDSRASDSDASNGPNTSQVLALGPALDALDALASGQALTLANLLTRKSWPWARL